MTDTPVIYGNSEDIRLCFELDREDRDSVYFTIVPNTERNNELSLEEQAFLVDLCKAAMFLCSNLPDLAHLFAAIMSNGLKEGMGLTINVFNDFEKEEDVGKDVPGTPGLRVKLATVNGVRVDD